MVISRINIEEFNGECQWRFGSITQKSYRGRGCPRHVANRRQLNGRTVIELGTETGRGGWDGCGTSYIGDEYLRSAQDLASQHGLRVKWEEVEKGLGYFYFEER